jgi:hypothetical protein
MTIPKIHGMFCINKLMVSIEETNNNILTNKNIGLGGNSGHAKGVLAFEYDPNAAPANYGGGFHLTHSIPGFPVGLKSYATGGVQWLKPVPNTVDPNYEWLSTGYSRGQTLFCYNIGTQNFIPKLCMLIYDNSW